MDSFGKEYLISQINDRHRAPRVACENSLFSGHRYIGKLETESAFTNPKCLLKTWWWGATFKQVPVPFVKRRQGRSKGTRPRAILAAISEILYWWTQWIVLGRRADRGRGRVLR